ncbi:hypothetical protein COL922a_001468 [Colletotrichum nupharicola]|nr:hypothetical protein COL922a_001468 [Colletotrichum nupharicola]
MEDLVRSFNALHRPRTTPTGLPNHWVFTVNHVPLQPPGDVVFAVHPQSRFVLQSGPGQIKSLSTAAEKAEAAIPLLLSTFIKGSESPGGRQPDDPMPFAPWTWSIDEPQLSAAVEAGLKKHGVTQELCKLGTSTAEEQEILKDSWLRVVDRMMQFLGGSMPAQSVVSPGDRSKCHGCGADSASFSQPLKKCSACSQAWYHSQDCQKTHWKLHKPTCLANRPSKAPRNGTTSSPIEAMGGSFASPSMNMSDDDAGEEAYKYYNKTARAKPEAQALMRELGLAVPGSGAPPEGIAKPVRRLILAGKDTPENMELFYGPHWRAGMGKEHHDSRMEILLNPPRGSPSYAMNKWLDEGAPARSPRPATEDEKTKIQQIKEIQEKVRQRVGAGKQPSGSDMQAILKSFGAEWGTMMPLYTLAVNTMDQGVQAPN